MSWKKNFEMRILEAKSLYVSHLIVQSKAFNVTRM